MFSAVRSAHYVSPPRFLTFRPGCPCLHERFKKNLLTFLNLALSSFESSTYITCPWHIFTNSESTIFFYLKNVLFSFKGAAKCLFLQINSFSNIFDLNRKILPCFRWKIQKICEENSWILKFGIRENILRTC